MSKGPTFCYGSGRASLPDLWKERVNPEAIEEMQEAVWGGDAPFDSAVPPPPSGL
jgi:hypothetical protein